MQNVNVEIKKVEGTKNDDGLYLCYGNLSYICKFLSKDKRKFHKTDTIRIVSGGNVFNISINTKVILSNVSPGIKIIDIDSFLFFLNDVI